MYVKKSSEVSDPIQQLPVEQIVSNKVMNGRASYYDYKLDGIWWSLNYSTCAVRDFERYSTLRVTNLDNGKTIDCYVNDYGPMNCEDRIKNGLDTEETCLERIIDLSSYAFSQLSPLGPGLLHNVKVEQLN